MIMIVLASTSICKIKIGIYTSLVILRARHRERERQRDSGRDQNSINGVAVVENT